MSKCTLDNFKEVMIAKAKKEGSIWENFGQKELRKMKDKYDYNPHVNAWSCRAEQLVVETIDKLDEWCSTFNL